MNFGLLLAVPRNEARKNPRKPASCSVMSCAFDAKKFIEQENGQLIFLGDMYHTTPSIYTIGNTSIAIDLLE